MHYFVAGHVCDKHTAYMDQFTQLYHDITEIM